MNIIILEDEQLAKDRLIRMIQDVEPNAQITASFDSVEKTANYLMNNEHPDLIFLDIEVVDGNSFELFDILQIESKVIFTTAYDNFAIQAFKVRAIDYLMKPLKKEELEQAIQIAKPIETGSKLNSERQYKERFLIKFGTKLKSVKTKDIAYIHSANKLSYFYLQSGDRIPCDFKLKDLEELLDPELFFRVNRQFIVHLDAIAEIQSYNSGRLQIQLNPTIKEKIVISTERSKQFKNWLEK